jgi:hypothetical protein
MDPLIELPALSQKHAARYTPYRTLRRARRHLVQIVHLVQKCVRRTSSVASSAQDTPVAGGSNPGPKRLGPADGALPVEVHLRSWGKERDQSGAEVVRPGSYPVSRVVPKKPSRMLLPGGLVRTLPKPETRARAHRGVVPLVLCTPQSREPNPGHTPERWLKSRSEAVRSGVGRFLALMPRSPGLPPRYTVEIHVRSRGCGESQPGAEVATGRLILHRP